MPNIMETVTVHGSQTKPDDDDLPWFWMDPSQLEAIVRFVAGRDGMVKLAYRGHLYWQATLLGPDEQIIDTEMIVPRYPA